MSKKKSEQAAPLKVGVWMEYFPDWLVSLGHDGISRLIGYVLSGFEERADGTVTFEFWGPSFAHEKIQRFVDDQSQELRDLCSVHIPKHANPFEHVRTSQDYIEAPKRTLSHDAEQEIRYLLELVSQGQHIYADGPYEFNVRSDFVLTALEANAEADVDVWYVPAPRFCHASLLTKPIVQSFPDYVYREFPRVYHKDYNPGLSFERQAFETMAQTALDTATLALTFSHHVKNTHVTTAFDFPADKVQVIRHGHVKLEMPKLSKKSTPKEDRAHCANLIKSHIKGALTHSTVTEESELLFEYMERLDWGTIPFIFFPTVLRPYKNISNVVAAIKILKEERDLPCRLVTTANLLGGDPSNPVTKYIIDNELMFDVLSLPRVPDNVLASLYALSTASIAPSFFEGGVPFMVTEALSVDTPVIVGDISVVSEVLGDKTKEFPFFDVHDPVSIADAIETVCVQSQKNQKALLKSQRTLFADVADRSWADASHEYEALFRSAIAQHGART